MTIYATHMIKGTFHSTYWVWTITLGPPLFLSADIQEQLLTFTHGMLLNFSYLYTDHLLTLDSCINPYPQSVNILSLEVYSPLNLHQWMQDLQLHPDKEFSFYILRGITEGFRIGFNRNQYLHSSTSNLHSSNLAVIYEQGVSLSRM